MGEEIRWERRGGKGDFSSPLSTTELENWTVGAGWLPGEEEREEGSKGSAATSVLL